MSIDQNCLIEILDSAGSVASTWRVLWIEKEDIVVIQLFNPKALPVWRKRRDIELELIQKTAQFTENDPFSAFYRPEETIPVSHRKCRDYRYQIITPIIQSGVKVFDRRERGFLIKEVIGSTGVIKKTIYSWLRSWWWGGQKPDALLPEWARCGGKGKERLGGVQDGESGSGKGFQTQLGRPRQQTKLRNAPPRIRVDKRIRKIIIRAAKLFYERKGMTLKDARQRMLERFFSVKAKDADGNEIPILFPDEQRPSLRQFVYWYYKDREARFSEALTNREGEHRYNTLHRELLSNSMTLAPHPGAFWQIDSTVLDIYAVSNLDRSHLIGRPILYLVVDVFSRLIVGFSLALEGSSWFGAALALENATTDKVQFCKEFGITIFPQEWLCNHLCKGSSGSRVSIV